MNTLNDDSSRRWLFYSNHLGSADRVAFQRSTTTKVSDPANFHDFDTKHVPVLGFATQRKKFSWLCAKLQCHCQTKQPRALVPNRTPVATAAAQLDVNYREIRWSADTRIYGRAVHLLTPETACSGSNLCSLEPPSTPAASNNRSITEAKLLYNPLSATNLDRITPDDQVLTNC